MLSGLPSDSRAIDFTTSSAPAVVTVRDALAEDQEGVRQIAKLQRLDCSQARPAAGS